MKMKLELKITDESGNKSTYDIERSHPDQPNNLNDFILKALSFSEDKRRLPFLIQCPNGLEVCPEIKMKFGNYGSPLLGDGVESLVVHWE